MPKNYFELTVLDLYQRSAERWNKMATGGDYRLSNRAIEELSEKISVKDMISIAIKYFGVDYDTIDNLKTKHREDITWISRDLLVSWRRSNPSDNQVQVSLRVYSQRSKANVKVKKIKEQAKEIIEQF